MNPIEKALGVKKQAESKLQGVGASIRKGVKGYRKMMANTPASKKAQAEFNRTGIYPN